ncbi:MAG: AbrB/MazE/SpoVT family DNA-binding domain-containing protein [Alphaproteobacteria bacterium]|jgi:AbrB family looped-hinge helix DNA binding protein|nr:AbrB/MazE/SpoVT family DNA-binding domain-containing protein [Alphaproteobacteria bacterium]
MDAIITSKGRVTLPKPLREALKLGTGDKVVFLIDEDGTARLIPRHGSVRRLKGCVPPPERPVSLEDIQHGIEASVLRRGQDEP